MCGAFTCRAGDDVDLMQRELDMRDSQSFGLGLLSRESGMTDYVELLSSRSRAVPAFSCQDVQFRYASLTQGVIQHPSSKWPRRIVPARNMHAAAYSNLRCT